MAPELAIVHDYLTQRGGAERVVATWARAYPGAPLYTTLFDPANTFDEFARHDVRTTWLNHVGVLRHHHRLALPLLAPTVSRWRVDADVVLASSSGWAHGVATDGHLVVYCHAPARWLYQRERYLSDGSLGARAALASRIMSPALRSWDQRAAHRAERYLVNSHFTRALVHDVYDIDAQVIAPPVTLAAPAPSSGPASDIVVVARLLPYKNVDLAIDVARLLPHRSMVVVGDGPLRERLEASAPANVRFVGSVSDAQLARHYLDARVHLALSHEDFGITPLEAALAGRPTVARQSGGYLDTITAATGVLVPEATLSAASVRDALDDALERSWNSDVLRTHAEGFSPDVHLAKIRSVLTSL